MLIRLLEDLEFHTNLHNADIPRRTKHPKARLILDPLINPAITDEGIPRLVRMFDGGIRIHIGNLAPRAPRYDIEIKRLRVLTTNPDKLP